MKLTSKAMTLSALALCFAGATQVASAQLLDITLTNSHNKLIDSFTLDSSAGQVDGAGSQYVLYKITNDTHGYNGVFFGDSATGGWFGIGPTFGNIVDQVISEHFNPALYSGKGLTASLTAGSSYTATNYCTGGDILHVAAVPEPETYGMMAAGLGLMGFMVRRKKSA